jgi:RNA recognition motif-containing protein
VDQVNLIRDKETTQSTGSAFVTFKKSESAQIAIEALNGQLFQGRPLKVTWPVKSDLKEREGLDDSSNVGVQMNAAQVTQLMTKYSASKDLANSAHTVPFVPVPSSFAPAVPVLTNCICLSNMFDLNWLLLFLFIIIY